MTTADAPPGDDVGPARRGGGSPATPGPASRRQRFREQTVREIKQGALQQIADAGGAGSLSLNALARSLGMAGPSLYRYFDSRDALLTELLTDTWDDLARTLEAAVPDGAAQDASGASAVRALRGYARAYRAWALAHPELYELLYGAPVPGYVAPVEATGPAAARSMLVLVRIFQGLGPGPGEPGAGPGVQVVPDGAAPGARWARLLDEAHLGTPAFLGAVTAWARVHGLITLELHGHFEHVVADPQVLYDAEVDRAAGVLP